jgi:outer membrane protein assembly factor BamE (lipoprotein component of BamABCDE complex)
MCVGFLLVGCVPTVQSTLGHPISPEAIASIQIGKTTKTEILSMFGNPHSISPTVGGDEVYKFVYMNTKANSSGPFSMNIDVDSAYQELNVTFKEEIVADYSSTRR